MSKVKVAILGGSGYTAVELIKILLRHPHAEIVAVTSRQDEHIADLHPSLLGRHRLALRAVRPRQTEGEGRAGRVRLSAARHEHGVDPAAAGTRHSRHRSERRLPAPRRERLRGVVQGDAPRPANLAQAVYGLPELYGERHRAAPGSSPTPAAIRRRRSSALRRSSRKGWSSCRPSWSIASRACRAAGARRS